MKLTRILPIILALCLLANWLSITASQILLVLALILWIILMAQKKVTFSFPAYFWALIAYSALSLVSCFTSDNPAVSFRDSRELLLFLIVPITYVGFSRVKEISQANLAILVGAFLSIIVSLFYAFFQASPGERISGFMGHYMTQAGLLMLFCALALSHFLLSQTKFRFLWGIGFVLASFAVILTLTRSAWIGVIVVVAVIIYFYKPKLLVLIPIVGALLFLVSPSHVKNRALSIFNPKAYSNYQRLEYLQAGLKIIRDYPFFGTGPSTVHVIFKRPKYELSEDARNNVHLHNNFIQIAAERGIPTLLVWLVFIVWVLLSLIKQLKNKDPTLFPLTAAAMAALLALLAAGLFEYNFGDSEITTLLLYLITIPFAAERLLSVKTEE